MHQMLSEKIVKLKKVLFFGREFRMLLVIITV